jgi:hypothetical protein
VWGKFHCIGWGFGGRVGLRRGAFQFGFAFESGFSGRLRFVWQLGFVERIRAAGGVVGIDGNDVTVGRFPDEFDARGIGRGTVAIRSSGFGLAVTEFLERGESVAELALVAGVVAVEEIDGAGFAGEFAEGSEGLGCVAGRESDFGGGVDFEVEARGFEVLGAALTPRGYGHVFDQDVFGGGPGLMFVLKIGEKLLELFLGFAGEDDFFREQSVTETVLGRGVFALFGFGAAGFCAVDARGVDLGFGSHFGLIMHGRSVVLRRGLDGKSFVPVGYRRKIPENSCEPRTAGENHRGISPIHRRRGGIVSPCAKTEKATTAKLVCTISWRSGISAGRPRARASASAPRSPPQTSIF